ncbi:hypothetical protein RN001_002140 [Aquatica leii]|uniref:C2H2-type domain-containing protein n=1 Tax=Aquatica leii TaxID=1421715 RepID=A0AAN7SLP2_9COLE|nr:hypothetical protein RN001_002140 [Aquatica leii]
MKCENCKKAFTRRGNLMRHQMSACAAKKLKVEGDGGHSFNDVWCELCEEYVRRHCYYAHIRSNAYKRSACTVIDNGVEKIAGAFGTKHLARAKEKLLETNSHLASEENREVVVTRHKRKPGRYISKSKSDEGEVSQLPRPPPIKRLQANRTNLEDKVETHSSLKILPNTSNASLSRKPEIKIDQRAFQYKTLQFLSTLKEQNDQIINQNNNILKF